MDREGTLSSAGRKVVSGNQPTGDELHSKMSSAKAANKQVSRDAQLLANRISLLKNEEAKAWKKILETKTRAEEILKLKEKQEVERTKRMELDGAAERDEMKKKDKHILSKQMNIESKKKNASDLHARKQESVKNLKKSRRKNEESIMNDRNESMEVAKRQREKLKRESEDRQIMKTRQIEAKQKRVREEKKRQIEKHTKETKQMEKNVKRMEQQEQELIARLQNTAKIQRSAYDHLKKALTSNTS